MVAVLMMTAKLATLGLFKRKVFQNKVYDVIVLKFHTRVESGALRLNVFGALRLDIYDILLFDVLKCYGK